MYKYETHLHTWPVSKCGRATVREALEFYKSLGYEGVFITNHFIDGNISIDKSMPFADKVEFYFSDYEDGVKIGEEIGIKVFDGLETSYKGTDFLIYGLHKAWFLEHPEIEGMKMSERLAFYMENGALVIQAHPFRDASWIDHIRLFPKYIHGVEIYNAKRSDLENKMAEIFAENYGLIKVAGSDNHSGRDSQKLAGLSFDTPLSSEDDFVRRVLRGEAEMFILDNEE